MARGGQGVLMVGAEDGPPALKQLLADGAAAAAHRKVDLQRGALAERELAILRLRH